MTPEEARQLKPGDIVRLYDGLYPVTRGCAEREIEIYMDGDYHWERASELTLVCKAENREDRKEDA